MKLQPTHFCQLSSWQPMLYAHRANKAGGDPAAMASALTNTFPKLAGSDVHELDSVTLDSLSLYASSLS